jgi:hypothetical protein
VNPGTDHRSSDNTVTKETFLVNMLTQISSRLGLRPSKTIQVKDAGRKAKGAHSSVRDLAARLRTPRWAVLGATLLGLCIPLANVASAQAAQPWWHLNTSVRPSTIAPGGEGVIVVQASNLGNSCTAEPNEQGDRCGEGAKGIPSNVSLTLPPGLEVVEEEGHLQVSFFTAPSGGGVNFGLANGSPFGAHNCEVIAQRIVCSTVETVGASHAENIKPLAPYELVELRVKVKDVAATPGEAYEAEASGGGASSPAIRSRHLRISGEAPRFGAEDYALRPEAEGGATDSRAGAHPYQLTADFNLDQNAPETDLSGAETFGHPPASPRNLHFLLPPGQVAAAASTPTCTGEEFVSVQEGGSENLCPLGSVIGAAIVTINEDVHVRIASFAVPLYNLVPAYGEPARFGFDVLQTPVVLDTAVRSAPGQDYGVTVTSTNTSQLVNFISSTVTFWGVPGDRSHDISRGWNCLVRGLEAPSHPCLAENQAAPSALLTLPTACSSPFATSVEGDSWPYPGHPSQVFDPLPYSLLDTAGAPQPLTACNQLNFDPQIHSEPTSNAATSPTGLSFDVNFEDEGLFNPTGRAQSQMKKAVVTLPQGFTTNPSVAEGLKACSEAEYNSATVEAGTGCTPESKVGEVEVTSPLVKPDQVLKGGLYVATQHANPNHNLLTLYLIAREPEIGVVIRQALKVIPNPVTGQLTTEVDNVPQLPLSHLHLSFRQGQRSPLVTPPACGPYTVKALLYPWSDPEAPVERTSSFQITQGPEGQGCPSGGVPPFHPTLEAGTLNNSAGTYSPFVTHITRKDSEQEITRFSIKLPTGLIAKLKGVSECSDARIAQAKSREVEGGGTVEQEHPSCPANSEIGHSLVGSGVGNVLAYAPGKLYLAGPYHGSPISIVSVTAAKVGPFDLGTVVVRFALDVNHETAEVSVDGANSDPIPHIVDGIPIHLRDIRAYVDRSNFTLNPTSCAKKSTAATVLGSGLNFASSSDDVPVTVSSPFQAADCASLGFKPKLALSLTGKKTHRGALPAFKAVLTYPKGGSYANIARAQVTLPGSEFLEQGHLKNVCTRKVFETGNNPGENCPKNSIYGKARAVTPLLDQPLEGPVYLRTGYGTRLPELAAALNGPQISITLAGTIDSVHQKGTEGSRIRNTFALVPDAPVERFTLELKGGKKGLLVNSTDVCKGTHKALAAFTGQNGKLDEYEPALKAQCGKSGAKKNKKSKGAGKKAGH